MRTTVGPLPPAVYWRRRAVVLGALLLAAVLLFVACGGNAKDANRGHNTSSQTPLPAPASSTPEEEPSFADAKPGGGGPALPGPGDAQPTLGDGTSAAPSAHPAGTNANVSMRPSGGTVRASCSVDKGCPVNMNTSSAR